MKRNFGLDILRASAILVVMFDHAWYFEPQSKNLPNPLSAFGFIGVELFFVLSGFLIGQIIVNKLSKNFSREKIANFYLRRWLRTLPMYYLTLITLILGSSLIYRSINLHLPYFLFLQNFYPKELDFFGVAWSLSIEEWFYLLLPIFFFIFSLNKSKFSSAKKLFVVLIVFFFAKVLVITSLHLSFEEVRKSIPLRFDTLLIGVLLAQIKIEKQSLYLSLQNYKIFATSFAVILSICIYYTAAYLSNNLNSSIFLKAFSFNIISLSVAGMIPFLESSKVINVKLKSKKPFFQSFTLISLISYSLYLIHLQVFTVFIKFFSEKLSVFILFPIASIVAFFSAALFYFLFEKPIMNLRDRFKASA